MKNNNNNNNITKNNNLNGKNFFAKNRIIIGVVMLVFSLIFGLLLLPQIASSSGSANVYVLKQDVKAGTVITMEVVSQTKTNDQRVISFAHTSEKNIKEGNLVALHDILQGEYLTRTNAAADKAGIGDVVPEGKEILSVPVESIHSTVSYTLRSGDIICFYHAFENEYKETEVVIPAILQYVEVFDVYDADGISCSVSGATPKSINLIVTSEQAAEVVYITSSSDSNAYYSLITSGDAEKAATLLEKQEDVLTKTGNGENVDDIVIDNSDIDSGNLEFNGELENPNEENDKNNKNDKNDKNEDASNENITEEDASEE